MKKIYSLLILLLIMQTGFAQPSTCPEVTNKKAIKLFEQSKDKKKYDFKERLEFLKKALESEPEYSDALFEMANMNIKIARADGTSFKPAEKYLLKLIEVCPDYDPYPYYYLAQIAYGGSKYEEAIPHLKKFLKNVDLIKSDEDYNKAEKMLKDATFYAEVVKNPVPFNPSAVPGVGTYEDEYLAMLSPDNELLYFTRKYQKKGKNELVPKIVEEFVESKRTNGGFDKGETLTPPFNVGDNYGGVTFSLDNKNMFITVCKPDKKTGAINCDIYSSSYVKEKWTDLKNLGPGVNTTDGWEAQPSLSADGKTLIFASARADSRGMDLYKSEKGTNGEWGPAINLGAPINTDGNEKSPFIHSDSQTLYFSSDGHPSVGGYDIYFTKMENKNWKQPKNIGFPINTDNDEVGFFVSTDGKLGYFASNQLKGKGAGGYDIFYFDLYKEARPEKILFTKGQLKDELGNPLEDAKMKIKNVGTKEVTEINVDSITGEYAAVITISNHEDFIMTVEKEDHAFNSQLIKATDSVITKPVKVDFEVKAVLAGAAYNLNNIYYNVNSAELKAESKAVIEEFANYLKNNPSMKIEIQGHTDNVGSDASNLALSTDRAFTVYALLMENEVPKSRISFKGYGASKPIETNSSPEGRAKNRRTQFQIIQK